MVEKHPALAYVAVKYLNYPNSLALLEVFCRPTNPDCSLLMYCSLCSCVIFEEHSMQCTDMTKTCLMACEAHEGQYDYILHSFFHISLLVEVFSCKSPM